jgi:ABC-type Fe3+ transport system permease subunit
VFVVDYFLLRRASNWNVSDTAPSRWIMVLPWALGFVIYQMINPGSISWWTNWWQRFDGWLHFTPPDWMNASFSSFLLAALVTLPVGLLSVRNEARRSIRAYPSRGR